MMSRAAVLTLLLWAVSAIAIAQSTPLAMEDLTWTELRDAIRGGKTTILVPIGGTEQNGPHMALGKHNARAGALSQRIAAKLGNALVAPVVAYVPEGSIDPPTQHMRFPGTISVPEDVFEKMLESAARSFRHHGFTDIVLLGDHGGYQQSLSKLAGKLNREWNTSARGKPIARVHAIEEYYRAADTGFGALLRSEGFSDREIGEHAGLADTALTMDTHPGMVRSDRLASKGAGGETGVRGDPTRANAQIGRKGTTLIVDATVEAIIKSIAAGRMTRPTQSPGSPRK